LQHDIEITTPGVSDELSSQKHFEAFKGFDVIVETEDPWKSNRVLEGTLASRDALELTINMKGRMVRIPNEMVKAVKLPKSLRE
jgi:ribosome maturation factor RimP